MKILIIGPSWVGDMVMSQSLYIKLKMLNPNASIDVLAPAWCKPILERMPEIDNALEMPIGHGEFNLLGRKRLGKQLQQKEYTHAYILPNSAKSALIPWFAKIPVRIGWKGEFRFGLLTDLRPNKRVFQYMVERYVALAYDKETMRQQVDLDACPQPKLSIEESSQQAAILRLGLSQSKPVVGLCPGAEFGPAKRWPDKHYAEVASYLIKSGYQVWLFGSVKDQEVTHKIRSALQEAHKHDCFDLAGKTSLTEVVDLLAVCQTVISNDSGLMHVSAAVGCNIVAIYGSSSPKYTPPLTTKLQMVHTDIECRPCFKRECPLGHQNCLNKLMPQQVISAINSFTSST
ncbi:lipopolysaccharide heptosyltransferase II [Vibrio sp. 10N.261.46.E12]|uniref:lipopolysaccharide heptosyltransferase II n=1 Tax=unclassified Vibrio TaxID=2614977 RepID=UPI00097684C5|nr:MULTISPECIES: lipopolysaccharide heptosyltransferase II [unclassified Vibrio]OMO38368.1 lipopolysaccharide heptosyltransferase II [Vibrio sp. 10N.261.45.E1]PMJ26059.1 lipopolysaccharide heptosyltransferase II [Vibrio sp. 10N.286.45.B6]PML89628.1 lipopolysaccharide heptosyltransferase II [Vibrio sp. 10N.261.49.E11]PMM69704.1 lipopolysaccharide heptosyltransferase II [Vibrio sp. 10N.261.46.F12]PMM90698.1 lipopolysaccharide heptosyltransferase II [Vibrio sp. 10N.261.46.E8]